MTTDTSIARLYLMQLSTTTVPLPGGRTLEMVLVCYLIETNEGKRILIDSGYPADVPRRADGPPSLNQKNVLEHLAELRLSPDDINMVIATHFDVDHAGYHDSFKKAEFVVQREHYELARAGHPRFAAARGHWDHPDLRYRLVDGDFEILPGLTLLETSGHARGHQSLLLRLPNTGPVLLAIDAVILERLFTIERKGSPMDDNEDQLLASTRKLLELVQRERVQLIVFGHDGSQWANLKKAPAFYD
ncbi:MAG: N-acyl homoserine lactonase family protein [Candidatus Acidiferrum sp.]|jgi:N-acyl homoserine lactone hydrolase